MTEIVPPPGRFALCTDLNDAGFVTGRHFDRGGFQVSEAFVWGPRGFLTLPAPAGTGNATVEANAIDNAGRVFGYVRPAGARESRPLLWSAGGLQSVPTLFANGSQVLLPSPSGIRLATNVLPFDAPTPGWKNRFGWVDEPDFTQSSGDLAVPVAIDLLGTTMLTAGFAGSYSAQFTDINDAGQAVGFSQAGGWNRREAIRWDRERGVIALGTGGRRSSFATAINSGGLVVGYVEKTDAGDINTDMRLRPFSWRDGVFEELPILPGFEHAAAADVNDAGVVVGSLGLDPANRYREDGGWIYRGGVMQHLDALLPPGSGWSVTDAIRVNNAGQILIAERTGPGFTDLRWAVLTPQ